MIWGVFTGTKKNGFCNLEPLEPTIKDIIGVKPNPGGPDASFDSAGKVISILACHSWTFSEIESMNKYEEAVWASHDKRCLVEALKISKSKPQQPAKIILNSF